MRVVFRTERTGDFDVILGTLGRKVSINTVDGRNLANLLRSVVYSIIYKVLAPSQVVSRISAINSIMEIWANYRSDRRHGSRFLPKGIAV